MRRGFTKLELIIVLATLLVLAVLLFPVFVRSHHPPGRSNCQSNLKQIGLANFQYMQDYTYKFPPTMSSVNSSVFGWADGLQPYLKSTFVLQCPTDVPIVSSNKPRAVGYTDYWMNPRLAGKSADKDIQEPPFTIMLGDGNDGTDATDARYAIDDLPTVWLKDPKSPLHRHLNGANYAFADGHVKWLKPEKIKAKLLPKGPEPTFAVR
jgi:prepilin-type processing-associated H-X9-DG protein